MEALTFSTYNFGGYPGYVPFYHGNTKFKHQNWNKKAGFGGMPEIPDYFEIYKRAQLKAILSQVNPNLTPRLRKANTKEFGVQVNPKVNATVQCSLGPKTLFYREDKWESPKTGSPSRPSLPSTPVNNVRFSRPVAIYSPVFDRRFFSVPARAEELDRDTKPGSSEEENCAEEAEKRETEAAQSARGKERQCPAFQSRAPAKFNFQVGWNVLGLECALKCSGRSILFLLFFFVSLVSGAEIWLLPLQQVQHSLGERVRLVYLGNLQGSQTVARLETHSTPNDHT